MVSVYPMEGFPVSICLRQYYGSDDPRTRCLLWATPEQDVRSLERRVRALLPCGATPPRLLLRGHWLPPLETQRLLHPGDTVIAIPCRDIDASEEETKNVGDFIESNASMGKTWESSAELMAPSSDDDLMQQKRQALALLEQCEAEKPAPAGERPARRRRVRRRRAARPSPTPPPAPFPPPGPPALCPPTVLSPPASRPARVVRPLVQPVSDCSLNFNLSYKNIKNNSISENEQD